MYKNKIMVFFGLLGARKEEKAKEMYPNNKIIYSSEEKKINKNTYWNLDFWEIVDVEDRLQEILDVFNAIKDGEDFCFISPVFEPLKLIEITKSIKSFGCNIEFFYVPITLEESLKYNEILEYPIPRLIVEEMFEDIDITLDLLKNNHIRYTILK